MYICYLGVDLNNGISSVVTTSMDEELLPVICQFMDYCYTDEGAIFSCWGPESVSWDWVDGERKHNDWVLNNPNNTTSVMHNVCRLNYWPRAKYADAEWDNYLKTLDRLGLGEAIEIVKGEFERYQAR